jgi:CheY-like chemotaxis protein
VLDVTPPGKRGKGWVLVVDDDASVRISTARMLKTLGYEVVVAADGASAEALVKHHVGELHFMVCDLAMPHQSGLQVAQAVRQTIPSIKVLFVSGYPRGSERELPAASFLQKPYDREALARKLTALANSTAD